MKIMVSIIYCVSGNVVNCNRLVVGIVIITGHLAPFIILVAIKKVMDRIGKELLITS